MVLFEIMLSLNQLSGVPGSAPSEELVDGTVRERYDKQIPVGPSLDVGRNPKVPADEQAFALGDVGLVAVVGYPALQPWIVHGDFLAITGQVEEEGFKKLHRQ